MECRTSFACCHSFRKARMNTRILTILLAGLLLANAWSANDAGAQAPAVQQAQQARQGERSPVTGQPYSAIQTVTIRRLLQDGDEFTRQTVTRLYRDGAGRMRRDTLDSEGELDHSLITDVDGATVFLDHKNQLVSVGGTRRQAAVDRGEELQRPEGAEPLGERDIEGVAATGFATKRQVGREGENLEVTTETWVSKDLNMTLYRKHSDPRFGDSTVEITEIDRREPDPALFDVPRDYQSLASQFRE